jgi:hypothetical protein
VKAEALVATVAGLEAVVVKVVAEPLLPSTTRMPSPALELPNKPSNPAQHNSSIECCQRRVS